MSPTTPAEPAAWTVELQGKPDFDMAMKRLSAWYGQAVIDRPPIRFAAHNADFAVPRNLAGRTWSDLKSRSLLREEVKPMTHNIFHVDGKGVLNHLDMILSVPGIQAIQWVQGMGLDLPIMQWVPLIKRLQAAGKSVMVDLQTSELEDFIMSTDREGVLLCLAADESLQPDIIKRVERWQRR